MCRGIVMRLCVEGVSENNLRTHRDTSKVSELDCQANGREMTRHTPSFYGKNFVPLAHGILCFGDQLGAFVAVYSAHCLLDHQGNSSPEIS